MDMNEVMLVDVKNLAYRLHFSNMNLTTRAGRPTSVLHGVLQTVLQLSKKYPESGFVFCSEGRKNWRKDFAPSMYKANRTMNPEKEKVEVQLPPLLDVLKVLGFKVLNVEGFEADDLIGILSRKLRVNKVRILSNDKDFFQLLTIPNIEVLRPFSGGIEKVKAANVLLVHGVEPKDWTKFRALCGDTSDNIAHIAGIGPKTAIKLLAAGLDPSLREFKFHPMDVRKRFAAQFAPRWKEVHLAYLLSYLPRKTNYKLFPRERISDLDKQIKRVVRDPRRNTIDDMDACADKFLAFLAEYELSMLMSKRHKFWKMR